MRDVFDPPTPWNALCAACAEVEAQSSSSSPPLPLTVNAFLDALSHTKLHASSSPSNPPLQRSYSFQVHAADWVAGAQTGMEFEALPLRRAQKDKQEIQTSRSKVKTRNPSIKRRLNPQTASVNTEHHRSESPSATPQPPAPKRPELELGEAAIYGFNFRAPREYPRAKPQTHRTAKQHPFLACLDESAFAPIVKHKTQNQSNLQHQHGHPITAFCPPKQLLLPGGRHEREQPTEKAFDGEAGSRTARRQPKRKVNELLFDLDETSRWQPPPQKKLRAQPRSKPV